VESVKVLVVDDDNDLREMMVGHLRKRDFQVEGAQDGLDAIQMLRSTGPFNVMVTDLMMPRLGGLELLRRARKFDPLLEVIVVTAAGSIEMAISALREDGAYDYLTKPFEMIGELSLAVERAAKHRQLKLDQKAMRGNLISGARRLKEILSYAGIPIIAGNERDEVILTSVTTAGTGQQGLEEENKLKSLLDENIRTLIRKWRSLGGNQIMWTEMRWHNGEDKLVKIAPLPMGESLGWVMVLNDITYLRKLERFVFNNHPKAMMKIKQPVEKASIFIEDLEERWEQGEGIPLDQLGELKGLFNTVQVGIEEISTFASNGSEPSGKSEVVPLQAFLVQNKNLYQKEPKNGRYGEIYWELDGDFPPVEVDQVLISRLMHHLLNYAKSCTEEKDPIIVKLWSAESTVWLSVLDHGTHSQESVLISASDEEQELQEAPIDQGQMELAVVKLIAEQIGCQVWVQEIENGGLSIAIGFPI
jgi:CheY-like chemotaxis protein